MNVKVVYIILVTYLKMNQMKLVE